MDFHISIVAMFFLTVLILVVVLLKLINDNKKLIEKNEAIEEKNKELSEKLLEKEEVFIKKEKMSVLGELLGSITHEIKNPLGAILTNIQMIKMDFESFKDKSEELKESFEIILETEKATKRAKNIVGNILNFMRKDPENNYKIDFYVITKSLNTLLKKEVEKDNIQININSNQGLYINGKSGEMIQVFLNLLLNARDSLLEDINNLEKKIELKAYAEAEEIVVEVIDNGLGIPEDIRDNIFEPFFTSKLDGQGTGLGLSIVKNIIEKNNGTINLETKMDKGTKFIVKLKKY